MPETDEEKRKRWAANAAKAYMTPQMMHAMNMSKYQSQNKYKAAFEKNKAKGYTPVASTPETERVKIQSERLSSVKYKKQFEKSKDKYTQVADNPEQQRLRKMTELSSTAHYKGKSALAQPKRRREGNSPRPQRREIKEDPTPAVSAVPEEENANEQYKQYGEEEIRAVEEAQEGIGDYGPGNDEMEYEHDQHVQNETTSYDNNGGGDYQGEEEGQGVYDNPEQEMGQEENAYDQAEENQNHGQDYKNEEEQSNYTEGYDATQKNEDQGEDVYESVEDTGAQGGNLDDFYASLN